MPKTPLWVSKIFKQTFISVPFMSKSFSFEHYSSKTCTKAGNDWQLIRDIGCGADECLKLLLIDSHP